MKAALIRAVERWDMAHGGMVTVSPCACRYWTTTADRRRVYTCSRHRPVP